MIDAAKELLQLVAHMPESLSVYSSTYIHDSDITYLADALNDKIMVDKAKKVKL